MNGFRKILFSFVTYTLLLKYPHKKMSRGVRSGDLADHSI
jgi:hypothetical protein